MTTFQKLTKRYEDFVREHYDIESNEGKELSGDERALILKQFEHFNEEDYEQGKTKRKKTEEQLYLKR